MPRFSTSIAIIFLHLVLAGTSPGQESATISDDGVAVTLAKVPESLKLASFRNHLGLAAPGTRVLVFETRRDPVVPVRWVKVKLLEGQFKSQTAWVMEPTVHKRKEASNTRLARDGASDGKFKPKEDEKPPAKATHWAGARSAKWKTWPSILPSPMMSSDNNPYESPQTGASPKVERSQLRLTLVLASLSICIGLLIVSFILSPFAWILRDGLSPSAVESSGLNAARRMFWCFYWGPVTLTITFVVVLLAITRRSLHHAVD